MATSNPVLSEKLKEFFTNLRKEVPDIMGLALVSSDGRIIEHDWRAQDMEPDKVGAIASTLLGFGKKTIEILSTGKFLQVLLQSTDATIGVYSAGPRLVLIVSMKQSGNVGILNLQSRKKAAEISVLFQNEEV
ncbi:MAG: hypothetical protein HGB19_10940 [Chlorobiales bacterium]|jgi:uncharacterized protein|nr:hypothetical protein [Chlorobiales bacterium]